MARLRIRKADDSGWLDICQTEWYVRDPSNTKWLRLIPGKLSARHGTNNYWVNIDCMTENTCDSDPYGGTPDGEGENGSGPGIVGPAAGELPDGPDNPNSNPSIGDNDSGGDLNPGDTDNVDNGSSSPDYTDPDAGSSEDGNQDGAYDPEEPYPPGYDLPDAGGEGAGLKDTGDIYRPGLNTSESYNDEPESSVDAKGTFDDPAPCPVTFYNDGSIINEFYIDLGSQSGVVNFEYTVISGRASIDIYYFGQRHASTEGKVSGSGSLAFLFDSAYGNGETKIMIRVRQDEDSVWMVQSRCPTEDPQDDYGTPADPAPCHGTFEPSHGGGAGVHEFVHDMGEDAGEVVIDYQMWYQADKMEIFQGGSRIASTNGFVSGVGQLVFNYTPRGSNTLITVRITSVDTTTSWVYLINCPDDPGSSANPMLCGGDSAVHSGGAGVTDTYYRMENNVGNVSLRYQMYNIMDQLDVFQNGNLLATTGGPVAGEDYLNFAFNPANGRDLLVRVTGEGKTSWSFLVECPFNPPALSVGSMSKVEGDSGSSDMCFPVSMSPSPVSRDVTVDYTTVDVTARSSIGDSTILATDEFNNPFIAVLEGTGGVGNVVFDGGFPKFYNVLWNSASSFSSMSGSFKYLHNCIQWIADLSKGNKVLVFGDANQTDTSYSVKGSGDSSFGVSIPSVISVAGGVPVIKDRDDYPTGEIPLSDLNQYAAVVVMGSRTDGVSLTNNGAALFGAYVQGGGGIMLITDHDVFQGTVNKIGARFNAAFSGNVNRSSIDVDTMVANHGSHPIWSGMSGESVLAGGSEGNIALTPTQADYVPAGGTLLIPAGQTSGQVCVPILGDTEEESNETFKLVLSNPQNATLGASEGVGTITNDDLAIVPCGQSTASGGSGITNTLHDIGSTAGIITVDYNAFGVPDQFEVFYNGSLVATTGGLISGTGTLSFFHNPATTGKTTCTVRVTGNSSSTGWNYTLNCPSTCSVNPTLASTAWGTDPGLNVYNLTFPNGDNANNGVWYAERMFNAPVDGTYTFTIACDDSSEIKVDCIDIGIGGILGQYKTATVALEAGQHHLQVITTNSGGGPTYFALKVTAPDSQVVASSNIDSSWAITRT